MNFEASSFFAQLLVSSVGFVAFSYGKSQRRLPQTVAGLTLLVFPYFVDSLIPMLAIAVLVTGLMVAAIKLGY